MKGIGKAIIKYDPLGAPIGITKGGRLLRPTYMSISEAARREGKKNSNIRAYLKHGKSPDGCMWKYAEVRS